MAHWTKTEICVNQFIMILASEDYLLMYVSMIGSSNDWPMFYEMIVVQKCKPNTLLWSMKYEAWVMVNVW